MTLIGVTCYKCFGLGMKRRKTMIGTYRLVPCPECNGFGKKLAPEGSGEHHIAAAIRTMQDKHVKDARK